MPRYFLDSSALVKRYHQESGSALVAELFDQPGNRFIISRLAIVELYSCFARLVRERELTQPDFDLLIAQLRRDVGGRLLAVAALSSMRVQEAAALLAAHGLTAPLRTLDAIHLATALAINCRSPLTGFVVADKRLLTSASMCGLATIDVS